MEILTFHFYDLADDHHPKKSVNIFLKTFLFALIDNWLKTDTFLISYSFFS